MSAVSPATVMTQVASEVFATWSLIGLAWANLHLLVALRSSLRDCTEEWDGDVGTTREQGGEREIEVSAAA